MRRTSYAFSIALLFFITDSAFAAGAACDVDMDGNIAIDDIRLISAARNTPANGPDDPRDVDGDGIITVLDARSCTRRCTLPRCAEPQANQPPVITSVPVTNATEGQLYTYDVEATDANGDTLTYSLDLAPAGMSIDPVTGLIQWTPAANQVGDNVVGTRVADGNGGFATQSFSISVDGAQDFLRPEVSILFTPGNTVDVGTTVTIQVAATDDVSVTSTALTINGTAVPLDASGTGTFSSSAPGIFNVTATAADAAANTGAATATLRFLESGDVTPPTAILITPPMDATITSPLDVIGTASDDSALLIYEIELSPADKNEFVTIVSGSSAVTNGVLGQVDPTLMMNGLYDLRLSVEDTSGNAAAVSVRIGIDRKLKFGEYALTFNDLELPAPGLPVAIDRTYDNRRKTSGDFGFGWTLDFNSFKAEENRIPGAGWETFCIRMIFGTCIEFSIRPTVDHLVVITRPDETREEFLVDDETSSGQPNGLATGNLVFDPLSGTFSTLDALNNTNFDLLLGGELLDFFSVLNPNRYRLTDPDGTEITINQFTHVESVRDANGNVLTYGPAGIIQSSGKSVAFVRDSEDRITSITDPLGNVITYEYDFYGDLVASTDQEGNTTRYLYDSNHGLLEVIRPLGDTAVRNEYDDEGRLIASEDVGGNRVVYTYDIPSRLETATDALGGTSLLFYDDVGNLLSETDPLGNTTTYTYDAGGNPLTVTDPLGNVSASTYDAQGNLISETDALGNTTSYTYNARNDLLSRTDPSGNTQTYSYDANGNLVSETDESGATTTYTHNSAGDVLTMTGPVGDITTFTYEANGDQASMTDPLGDVTTYTYDLNGNQLAETLNRSLPAGGTETLLTTRTYDGLNRLIREVDPLGNVTEIFYDANGDVIPNP